MPAADKLKLEVKLPDFDTQISFEAADALAELKIKTLQSTEDMFGAISAEYDRDVERFRRMLAEKIIDDKEFNQAREQLSIQSGAKIKEAYDKERAEVKKLGEGFTNAMDSAFGDAFSQLLEKGKIDFKEFTLSLIRDLAKVYVQMQILRPIAGYLGNGLSGMIGDAGGVAGAAASGGWSTSVIPGLASGGPVEPGKPYLVGEEGPEVIVPERASPAAPPRAALANFLEARGQARAAGGPVASDTPYLVGERGPEVIIPKAAGTVIPNDALRGQDRKSVV